MKRALSLVAVCLLALAHPAAQAPQPARPADRPNVVLIITDDVGYGDLSSYGAPDLKTPNIDSLARDGVRLTDFYANGSTCSPTRTGLMTGRYQQRYLIEVPLGAGTGATVPRGLRADGATLPRLMKNHGYATGLVGKWHLGYGPDETPNGHGFDYFFGFRSGLVDYYMHTDQNGQSDLFENDTPVQQDGYMTDLITARAVKFIDDHKAGPFFLDVAYSAAHWPYQPPDKPSKAPDNARHVQPHEPNTSTRADYVAMLERADRGVGEILATLRRNGLDRNTIVIFTNDNGGEWLSRNAPLFNRKNTLWEGGIRVPALVRWPGRIPAGRVSPQVGITMDLTATILAATGAPVPATFEGMNLMPILEGRAPVVERTLFWRQAGNRNQRVVRKGDWKLMLDGAGVVLLYDVRKDVGERNDVAAQRSDIAQQLRPLIAKWEADVDAEAKTRDPNAGRGTEGGRGEGRGGRGRGVL
jgi:arylsulfatase A-like enzyme